MAHVPQAEGERVTLQMTSMIDVVFQLLIFFMLTFKVLTPESQFSIEIPTKVGRPSENDPMIPDLRVTMAADDKGDWTGARIGRRPFGPNIIELAYEIADASASGKMPVEIDADPKIKYQHVMELINACAGLGVRNIKFAPPRSKAPAP